MSRDMRCPDPDCGCTDVEQVGESEFACTDCEMVFKVDETATRNNRTVKFDHE